VQIEILNKKISEGKIERERRLLWMMCGCAKRKKGDVANLLCKTHFMSPMGVFDTTPTK
jgi:hypothetical protein